MKQKIRSFFTTESGEVVIAQKPNWPLWAFLGMNAIKFLTNDPQLIMVSNVGADLFLLYWSYLEIRYGVNQWRQFLGWLVGSYTLIQAIII